MPRRGGDSSNRNIARDAPMGRLPQGLAAEALENDLGNLISEQVQNSGNSQSLTVADSDTTIGNVVRISLIGSLTATAGSPGEAIVSDGATPGDTDFRPLIDVDFAAMSENYSENVDRNNKPVPLNGIDQFRYIIKQTNTGGGTYVLQYRSGASWVDVNGSYTTAGSNEISYTSGWIDIPDAVLSLGEAIFRVSKSGTTGDTDTSLCTVQFRGPFVQGKRGPAGGAGGVVEVWQPVVHLTDIIVNGKPVEQFVYAKYTEDSGDEVFALMWGKKFVRVYDYNR